MFIIRYPFEINFFIFFYACKIFKGWLGKLHYFTDFQHFKKFQKYFIRQIIRLDIRPILPKRIKIH